MRDGYDVRGYMYWTLIDNFEWNFAWLLKFGIYEWDETKEPSYRKFREGAAVGPFPAWPASCERSVAGHALLEDAKGMAGARKPHQHRCRLQNSEVEHACHSSWSPTAM